VQLQAALHETDFDGADLLNSILQATLDRAALAVDELSRISILEAGLEQVVRVIRMMQNAMLN